MKIKNLTQNLLFINDLGELQIPINQYFDIGFMYSLPLICSSNSIKQLINENKIIINDNIRDLNKDESLKAVTLQSTLEIYNPQDYEYMMQANLIQNCFYNNSEDFFLKNNLKNCFLDFLLGQENLSEFSNVQFNGRAVGLSNTTEGIQNDNFDSLNNWNCLTVSDTSLSLEYTIKYEGIASGKFVISSNVGALKQRRIRKTFSVLQDFSLYDVLSLRIFGNGGEQVRIEFVDQFSNVFSSNYSLIKSGWQKVSFDISLLNRKNVKYINICVIKNTSNELITYFDDMRLVLQTQSYNQNGYIISNNINTITDISHIYFNDFVDLPDGTDYNIELSLDDGQHWHQIDINNDKGKWLDVSLWAEQFDNKRNIKMKCNLTTTDISVTPQIDDYVIMWKLKI